MSKSDKSLAGVALAVAGVFVLNWLKQFRFELVESGADTLTRGPDWIDETRGIGYYLAQPQPIGEEWLRYLGTMVSTEEVPAEEAPAMAPAKPATPTTLLNPAYVLIGVSGQSDVSEINGLVPTAWTKDGARPHIDNDGIIRIHVVTSTGCA